MVIASKDGTLDSSSLITSGFVVAMLAIAMAYYFGVGKDDVDRNPMCMVSACGHEDFSSN